MRPSPRQTVRLVALVIATFVIAVGPSILRRVHPLRWLGGLLRDVAEPSLDAVADALGLEAQHHEPADLAIDAVLGVFGIVGSARRGQPR